MPRLRIALSRFFVFSNVIGSKAIILLTYPLY